MTRHAEEVSATRKFSEGVSTSGQTARDDAGTTHGRDLAAVSLGRSAPCAPSLRSEGGRPARLLAARGAEDVSILFEEIVQRLPKVCGLGNPRQVRQFPKLRNRVRRVIARHLCLIAFRF